MTDPSDHLRAARESLRHGQQLDEARPKVAEEYYAEAERQYVEAGVDPDWFDDAALVDALDETPAPLVAFHDDGVVHIPSDRGLNRSTLYGILVKSTAVLDVEP